MRFFDRERALHGGSRLGQSDQGLDVIPNSAINKKMLLLTEPVVTVAGQCRRSPLPMALLPGIPS